LLAEAGIAGPRDGGFVSVDADGLEAAADWDNLKSPETYVGYDRTENFASRGGADVDRRRVYAAPAGLALNQWALAGEWTMGRQATVLSSPGGRIVHRFHARDLHLVMGPSPRGTPVRFRVSIDGQAPGPAHGLDIDDGGNGHRRRTAVVSADTAAEANRRSNVRDRIPGCWRRGIRLHVRLMLCA
jgi:hypothetical protein